VLQSPCKKEKRSSLATAHRSLSSPTDDSKALINDVCVSSVLSRSFSMGIFESRSKIYHWTLWPSFSIKTLTVAQENRAKEGNPNVGSKEDLNHDCVFGSTMRIHYPWADLSLVFSTCFLWDPQRQWKHFLHKSILLSRHLLLLSLLHLPLLLWCIWNPL